MWLLSQPEIVDVKIRGEDGLGRGGVSAGEAAAPDAVQAGNVRRPVYDEGTGCGLISNN